MGIKANSTGLNITTGQISNDNDLHIFLKFGYIIVSILGFMFNIIALVGTVPAWKTSNLHGILVNLWLANIIGVSVTVVKAYMCINENQQQISCLEMSTLELFWFISTGLFILLMAVERYFFVREKFSKSTTKRDKLYQIEGRITVLMVWCCSIFLALYTYLSSQPNNKSASPWECGFDRMLTKPFLYSIILMVIILPLMLTTFLNCKFSKSALNYIRSVGVYGVKTERQSKKGLANEVQCGHIIFRMSYILLLTWIPYVTIIFLNSNNGSDNSIINTDMEGFFDWTSSTSIVLLSAISIISDPFLKYNFKLIVTNSFRAFQKRTVSSKVKRAEERIRRASISEISMERFNETVHETSAIETELSSNVSIDQTITYDRSNVSQENLKSNQKIHRILVHKETNDDECKTRNFLDVL